MATVQRTMTMADLARVTDKAELIDGQIVLLIPTSRKPGRVGGRIYRSLDDHATASGQGEAYPDNVGFCVPRLNSGRESSAPDASYHFGPFPADPMRFLDGPPALAVEVRSESDYGPAAQAELAASETTISRPAPRWSGTSTRSPKRFASTGLQLRTSQSHSDAVKSSMPKPCSRAGGFKWTGSSLEPRAAGAKPMRAIVISGIGGAKVHLPRETTLTGRGKNQH